MEQWLCGPPGVSVEHPFKRILAKFHELPDDAEYACRAVNAFDALLAVAKAVDAYAKIGHADILTPLAELDNAVPGWHDWAKD